MNRLVIIAILLFNVCVACSQPQQKNMIVSDVAMFDLPLGTDNKQAGRILKRLGYRKFYTETQECIWGGNEIISYYCGSHDEYPVTIKIAASDYNGQVCDAEVQYHNHLDTYELNEHLQDIADEIKAKYPYRMWEECTPTYQSAASLLNQKSGKDRIFKNITIVEFSGHYRLYRSADDGKDDFYGTITIDVHKDNMHNDHVIVVRYNDRDLTTYIRRAIGKYQW